MPSITIDLTAKRKFCGSIPCPRRRTKLYVETTFGSNHQQLKQTYHKDPTLFDVPDEPKCESIEYFGPTKECDKARTQESNREAAAKVRKVVGLYEESLSKKAMQLEAEGKFVSSNDYMLLAKDLQRQHEWIGTQRQFGAIPGIEVGDSFKYRAQLVLVGLHCQFINGIDYVVENGNMLATSIVHSGRYHNDMSESFDILDYSGHGGNPMVKGSDRLKHQKLERGNMALKNNIRTKTPVRVICCSKDQSVPIYTYCGLYSAEEVRKEREQSGKLVFKFVLRRIAGQPPLIMGKENRFEGYEKHRGNIYHHSKDKKKTPPFVLNEMELAERKEKISLGEVNEMEIERKDNISLIPLREVSEVELFKGEEKIPLIPLREVNEIGPSIRKEKGSLILSLGKVNEIDHFIGKGKGPMILPLRKVNEIDLSQGKEKIPIRVVNEIDNKLPTPFNYITRMVYPHLRNHSFPRCCKGDDGCCEHGKCHCAGRKEGECPFYENGLIVKFGPLIYECGPSCKCYCPNRVSQSGIKFQLEVFKSRPRSWGVRSRDYILCGSFICEYVGEVFGENEVERRVGKEKCLFDIGYRDDDNNGDDNDDQSEGFTIDATHFGNVARFMDRSYDPNVWVQYVLYDHDDKRMPHVMLFAMKNIPPLQELTLQSCVMR